MRQLAKQHGHKLLQLLNPLSLALGPVVLDYCPRELSARKQIAKARRLI